MAALSLLLNFRGPFFRSITIFPCAIDTRHHIMSKRRPPTHHRHPRCCCLSPLPYHHHREVSAHPGGDSRRGLHMLLSVRSAARSTRLIRRALHTLRRRQPPHLHASLPSCLPPSRRRQPPCAPHASRCLSVLSCCHSLLWVLSLVHSSFSGVVIVPPPPRRAGFMFG